MTKKEALQRPPLLFMFEEILGSTLSVQDSKDWRECQYSCHVDWVKPMVDDGLIVEVSIEPAWKDGQDTGGRSRFNYHRYRATEEGIVWWVGQRAGKVLDRASAYEGLGRADRSDYRTNLTGKGIGAELLYRFDHGDAEVALCGIEDGYFEFVQYYTYKRSPWSDYLIVRLTRKGMEYFDSLPRLILECA